MPCIEQLGGQVGSREQSVAGRGRQLARRGDHWSTLVDLRVLDVIAEWQMLGEPALLPIRNGAEMTPPAAERHWLGLLRRE